MNMIEHIKIFKITNIKREKSYFKDLICIKSLFFMYVYININIHKEFV